MEKKASNQVQPSGTQHIWASISRDAAIKVWASDLLRLMKLPYDFDDWNISGQGVVIEADDEANVRDLIEHVASEVGMELHVLDGHSAVRNLPEWFERLQSGAPAMVFLGAGSWQGEKFAEKHPEAGPSPFDEEQCRQFRSELVTLMTKSLPTELIVLVTVAASGAHLDLSLRGAGLFDRRIQMPRIPDDGLAHAFIEDIGRERCGASILEQTRKVACLLRHEYPDRRRRLLMQKAMQRLAWREGRLLAFDDMVRFACYGTGDVDPTVHEPEQRRRNAVHEAGHAVVSHLTSRLKKPPEFCSIMARDDSHGIVVSAFDSHERNCDDLSWKDMMHKLQVLLAGRVAEHLVLGAQEVSANGASSDLMKATELACSMFGLWGLSDDHSSAACAARNLAVVINEASTSEAAHVEGMVRGFLQKIFEETLQVLAQYRAYLDCLVEALTERHFLLQEDLQALYEGLQATTKV